MTILALVYYRGKVTLEQRERRPKNLGQFKQPQRNHKRQVLGYIEGDLEHLNAFLGVAQDIFQPSY